MNPLAVVNLSSILLVATGGAVGCVMRFVAIKKIVQLNPTTFPLGTMFVNVVGSLIIGALLAKYGAQRDMRVFFVSGMLGGFTTFSAFAWDAVQLLNRGQSFQAAAYIGGSVFLSMLAVAAGAALVR
jgi:CrcB protein